MPRRKKKAKQKNNNVGTHSAFREMIADFEYQREKTISDAECFMKYQISFIQHYFDQDINALDDEYEVRVLFLFVESMQLTHSNY